MIVGYDAAWPARFAEAAAELRRVDPAWLVEHVGSTSVPGLAAKPVIDLAVRVGTSDEVTQADGRLADLGWRDVGAGPRTHLVRVKTGPDGGRTHIAHFFTADAWDTCQQRLFAAWLRDHPEDRRRYEQVKRRAVGAGHHGRAYTAAKTAFVQDVVDRARAGLGLPPAPVWDKER